MEDQDDYSRKQTDQQKYTLANLDPKKKAAILDDLQNNKGTVAELCKTHGVSNHTMAALRREAEDGEAGFNLSKWKRQTANTLAHFVGRGAERLVAEVDQIPLGNLSIAVAIAIDKIAALHDAPQTVVEHRLKVSQEGIAELLRANSVEIDAEIVEAEE